MHFNQTVITYCLLVSSLSLSLSVEGPFVMNTHDEILAASRDYSLGINGFERAVGWQSKIGLRGRHTEA